MLPFPRWRAGGRSAFASFLFICLLFWSSGGSVLGQKAGPKGRKPRLPASLSASGSPGAQNLTDIPLPIGHEARGLVLPDFDADGRLRGKFVAGSARRLDQGKIVFYRITRKT